MIKILVFCQERFSWRDGRDRRPFLFTNGFVSKYSMATTMLEDHLDLNLNLLLSLHVGDQWCQWLLVYHLWLCQTCFIHDTGVQQGSGLLGVLSHCWDKKVYNNLQYVCGRGGTNYTWINKVNIFVRNQTLFISNGGSLWWSVYLPLNRVSKLCHTVSLCLYAELSI